MRSKKYLRSATTRMPITPCGDLRLPSTAPQRPAEGWHLGLISTHINPCALALEEKTPLNGIVVLDIDVDAQTGVGHLEPWSLTHICGGTSNGRIDGIMQRGGCARRS